MCRCRMWMMGKVLNHSQKQNKEGLENAPCHLLSLTLSAPSMLNNLVELNFGNVALRIITEKLMI